MERRELLKAMGAMAGMSFTRLPYKNTELDAVEIAPKKYWVFYDDQRVDIETVVNEPWPWPGIDAEFFRVRPGARSVQDCLAIYKIDGQ